MELNKSSEIIISDQRDIRFEGKDSKIRIVSLVALAVGVIFLVVGIVLIVIAVKEKDEKTHDPNIEKRENSLTSGCDGSEEAKRIGLHEFLHRVKATYYELHPYEMYYDPDVKAEKVKANYVAYDPTPAVIKTRTDKSLALLKEIKEKKVNEDALKSRERKALAQVKHYLQHTFGQPYDVNYYAGDWMMGPNLFCWQAICYHGYAVYGSLGTYHKPNNASDVELIEKKLKTHKAGILQYIENMKMGVRRGMVRSVEECKAGIDSIELAYSDVSLHNATGVLKAWFAQPLLDPLYYSDITKETNKKWKEAHKGKNVSETVKEYLVKYLGEPLEQMLRYIEEEHSRHCVPSNVSSGLASLPLKYVWIDGKENKSWPTEPNLPTGEPLDGKLAYSQIMSFFTTNKMTPMEVHELGKKQLDILYPTVVDVAKEITGEEDNQTAVKKLREILNSSEIYFNSEPIPKNESDKEAHRKCSDTEGAKKYCPKRWAAIQLWFAQARTVSLLP